MPHMSKRFNFDDFDELCREALDDKMAAEGVAYEEEQAWAEHDRVPGEIGGVICQPTVSLEIDETIQS